jgi:AcrR family transcriptional regulator
MPRAARPRLSHDARREQIVSASLSLFARQGFSGTTTRALARAAGVSEALIYRLFPTKCALYDAIIQRKIAEIGRAHAAVSDRVLHDRDAFRRLAEDVLGRIRRDDTFLRLLLYSGLERHALSDIYFETHVVRVVDALRGRIERGARAGRYRRVDALLAARGFMAMVVHTAMTQALFAPRRWAAVPPDRAARTFVDLFFSGLERGGRR